MEMMSKLASMCSLQTPLEHLWAKNKKAVKQELICEFASR